MRRLVVTMLMVGAGLMAQSPASAGSQSLLDCIEAPYAYVSLGGGSGSGSPSSSTPSSSSSTPSKAGAADRSVSAVQRLLADPSLDVVFGGGGAGNGGGSSRALSLVRGMLSRGATELELAMTGIVARRGQPLLVLRARLRRDQANKLRLVLEETTELATPNRLLGGHQTYILRGTGLRDNGTRGPGEVVEMAMVGCDLVVGNDSSAMREVLVPQPKRTSTTHTRRVLAGDPRFQSLRKRLDVPAGSLLVYADWQRLGRRLQSSLTGVPAQLLGSSGLGSARSMMMTITSANAGGSGRRGSGRSGFGKRESDGGNFAATLLLEFASGDSASSRFVRGRGGRGRVGIDGWFAATQPVTAKKLMRELPRGGLGGMVLSVDLAAVAAHSPRSSLMVWDLRDAYIGFGLDFDRNVLDRLASRGTVQLHFGPGDASSGRRDQAKDRDQAFAAVTPVYSVRAKSRAAAEDLFGDLRRVIESTNFGEFQVVKDAKGKRLVDVIHLHGAKHQMSAFICVHNDSVLLAESQETLVQVHQELRRSKPRSRRDQLAVNAIKAIGGERVAGLFDLDLDPLFQRIASALSSSALGSSALRGVDLSSLPKRHIGYIDTDRHQDGAVVRIRVLSSR